MVRGLKDEKEVGENEDKEGGGTVGRDGHGQELMRPGRRWMADTVREMRERLKSYYQHLGWEISRCHGTCVCMVFASTEVLSTFRLGNITVR